MNAVGSEMVCVVVAGADADAVVGVVVVAVVVVGFVVTSVVSRFAVVVGIVVVGVVAASVEVEVAETVFPPQVCMQFVEMEATQRV